LRAHPEFEVLRAIVIPDGVAMMNRLFWKQISTQEILHDQDVLKDVEASLRPWVSGLANNHISGLMSRAPAFPVAVEDGAVRRAGRACG
jgi:hypothetical protein